MRAKQDNLHEPRRPITGLECEHYRGETDGERDTSFSEAARSIDLCHLKIADRNISCTDSYLSVNLQAFKFAKYPMLCLDTPNLMQKESVESDERKLRKH